MKNDNSSNAFVEIGILVIILSVLAIFNMDDVIAYQRKASLYFAKRKVEREMLMYRNELPEKMLPFFDDLPCEGTLTVQSNAGIKNVQEFPSHYYIFYDLRMVVVLETEQSLEYLSDSQIYHRLKKLSTCTEMAQQEALKTYYYPDALIYKDKIADYVYMSSCDRDDSVDRYIIKTPEHEYLYGPWMEFSANRTETYYEVDGRRHDIPHETPASYASSSDQTESYYEPTGHNDGEHCTVILCNNMQQRGYLFCSKHKCCVTGCPRQRMKNESYCKEHHDEFQERNGNRTGYSPRRPTGYSGSSGSSSAEDYAEEWRGEFDDYDEAYEYYEENE